MVVNKTIPKPQPPHEGVTPESCVCGEHYKDFRSNLTFEAAADLVRHHNGAEEGGGYRSRGPVLWMMRCMKLELFYEKHRFCK